MNKTLLYIQYNDIVNLEIAPRKPWIMQAMINKMEEKKKSENYKFQRV